MQAGTIVDYYLSLVPLMIHSSIYVLVSLSILGLFMSLYFYLHAACIDFQQLIKQMDEIQLVRDGFNRRDQCKHENRDKLAQVQAHKMNFIQAVSLHREINTCVEP